MSEIEHGPDDLALSGAELVAEHTGRLTALVTGAELVEAGFETPETLGMAPESPEWRTFYNDPLVSDEQRAAEPVRGEGR